MDAIGRIYCKHCWFFGPEMALLSGVTSAVPMQTIRKCCHRWRNLVWNMQSFKQFSYYWLCEPTFLKIILSVIITLWEDITQLNKIWCQIHGSFCHLWQHQLVVCTRTVKLLSPPMVVPSMWPNAETKVNPCHYCGLANHTAEQEVGKMNLIKPWRNHRKG